MNKVMNMIRVSDYCALHRIDGAFIDMLESTGLVTLVTVEEERYIPHDTLDTLERLTNWHYELEINAQGLEVVNVLYDQIVVLQEEISRLKAVLKSL
jgi:hypothetical protein